MVRAANTIVEQRHDEGLGRRSTDLLELTKDESPGTHQREGPRAEELHLVAAPQRHHARGGCVYGWVGGLVSEVMVVGGCVRCVTETGGMDGWRMGGQVGPPSGPTRDMENGNKVR